MDRIETLEKRVAQLEEWRADAEQRLAKEGANNSERYTSASADLRSSRVRSLRT